MLNIANPFHIHNISNNKFPTGLGIVCALRGPRLKKRKNHDNRRLCEFTIQRNHPDT